jgi:hypothetical protein
MIINPNDPQDSKAARQQVQQQIKINTALEHAIKAPETKDDPTALRRLHEPAYNPRTGELEIPYEKTL